MDMGMHIYCTVNTHGHQDMDMDMDMDMCNCMSPSTVPPCHAACEMHCTHTVVGTAPTQLSDLSSLGSMIAWTHNARGRGYSVSVGRELGELLVARGGRLEAREAVPPWGGQEQLRLLVQSRHGPRGRCKWWSWKRRRRRRGRRRRLGHRRRHAHWSR